jgi:hypothetical protein
MMRKKGDRMIVKIIVVAVAEAPQVIFGDKNYNNDYHAEVAYRNNIDKKKVVGGGLADLSRKMIFGTSYGFGPYDPSLVKRLLPDWVVKAPSPY